MSSGFTGYKGSSIATPGSVQSLRMTGGTDGPPPSVESPASVTPSPLPTPRTPHSQPASVNHHGMYIYWYWLFLNILDLLSKIQYVFIGGKSLKVKYGCDFSGIKCNDTCS